MKIQIILEDKGNGNVSVVFRPALADMVRQAMNSKAEGLSPAQSYAMVMASAVKEASKNLDKYDSKRIVNPNDL